MRNRHERPVDSDPDGENFVTISSQRIRSVLEFMDSADMIMSLIPALVSVFARFRDILCEFYTILG